MPETNSSRIVSFDADAASTAIQDATDGLIRAIVEYDSDAFHTLYAADETLADYGDDAAMKAHFERIHSYVDLDFAELDLFTDDLFPTATAGRYLITGLDSMTLIRLYRGREGLFVAVPPDAPVDPIITAVEDTLEPTG